MTQRMLTAALACAALTLVLAPAAARAESETDYYAAYLNGQKIGYMVDQRQADGDTVTSRETIHMTLSRGQATITVRVARTYVESAEGEPRSFTVEQQMSGMTARTVGRIRDGQIKMERQVGQTVQQATVPYPDGALMPEGVRLLEQQKGQEPGTEYTIRQFDPDSATAVEVETVVGERETVDVLGTEYEAARINAVLNANGTKFPTTVHVTEDGKPVRVEMSFSGLKITMLKCDKAYAMSPAKSTTDFLDAFLLDVPQPVPEAAREVAFTLKPKPDMTLKLPTTDTQTVTANEDGTMTVVVRRLHVPEGQPVRYMGDDPEAREALKPTQYVQSDDVQIRAVAAKVVRDKDDGAKAAEALARWVHGNVLLKDLSVGYASASEVMQQRRGDCSEHSVLLTAMCRAVGIPARTVSGMVYADSFLNRKQVLGGHQWTQVYLDGQWIDIDGSREAPWQCANRITQTTGLGDSSEWYAMASAFGTFTVENVEVKQ